ncbi:MAG: hypothetical protein ABSE49_15545 [Polyangiaceae bacterium]|jgi:hypothetical protein
MRIGRDCALFVLLLVGCSSGFSAAPGDGGSDTGGGPADSSMTDVVVSVEGGSDATADGAMSGETGTTDAGEGGADGGCSGLVCGGACVPNDVHNCGACGHDCTALPHVSGPVSCSAAGACVFPVSSCAPGWTQCLTNADLGCETNIATTANCGSCGNMCTGSTPVCSGSGSTYACASGCPTADPTLCSGTCVDTTSNASDCNACGNVCMTSVTHAQATCVSSACSFSCNSGYTDCTGACVDTTSDSNNCNGCGIKCGTNMQCVNSACECTAGLTNCNGTCVNTSSTVADCGTCGHDCMGGACTSGVCKPWVVAKSPTTKTINAIAADSQYFVWSDDGLGAVLDVPLTGATATTAVTVATVPSVAGVAVAGTRVELLANASGTSNLALWSGTAGQASSASVVYSTGAPVGGYQGPVFDPAGNSAFGYGLEGQQVEVCAGGTTCTVLYTEATLGTEIRAAPGKYFLLDQAGNVWVNSATGSSLVTAAPGATSLAVDSVNVYWSTSTTAGGPTMSSIYASSLASGTITTLVTLPVSIDSLAADGTNVYFNSNETSIQYVPITSSGASSAKTLTTAAIDDGVNTGIVAAAGLIFWDLQDQSTVYAVRFP